MRDSDKFFYLIIEELNMGNLLGQKIGKKKLPKNAPVTLHDGCNYREILNTFRDACKNQQIKWYHVVENPLLPWDYYNLSANRGITMDIVERTPELPWDYTKLSQNPNVTREFYENHLDKDWSVFSLTQNPNFDIDYILSRPELCKNLKWSNFSRNPNVTWDIIVDNPKFPWQFDLLSSHPNITWDHIMECPNPYERIMEGEIQGRLHHSHYWFPCYVSLNPNVNWDIVESYPEYKWDYKMLSSNPNINYAVVKTNPQKKWLTENLLYNVSFSVNDVFELFYDMPKYMRQSKYNTYCNLASLNPNLTVDIFKDYRTTFVLSNFVVNRFGYYCPITNFYERSFGYYE
jgi:hypothetical protein